MSEPKDFKVGDKVKTTKAHDQWFGYHGEGIIDRIDGDYIDLYVQMGAPITMHIQWIEPYEGDFNWFYRGKSV